MLEPVRVLLVQSWVIPGTEIRAALRASGLEPKIFRVDFESALQAALPRSIYDVIVLDSRSTGLARATVESFAREHGIHAPIVEHGELGDLGARIRKALAAVRN